MTAESSDPLETTDKAKFITGFVSNEDDCLLEIVPIRNSGGFNGFKVQVS